MAENNWMMDTEAFCTVWAEHMGTDNQWRAFVLHCFSMFAIDNDGNEFEYHGYEYWSDHRADGEPAHRMAITLPVESMPYTDDQKYQFLSEKCYAKCQNIKSKIASSGAGTAKDKTNEAQKQAAKAVRKARGEKIRYPDGYLSRSGKTQTKKKSVTAEELTSWLGIDL